jgi:hypothetical protein
MSARWLRGGRKPRRSRSVQCFDIKTNAPTVIMPILIAFGKVTDADDLAAVRAQLPAMSTQRKQLVVLDEGHTGADASDGAREYARCIDLSARHEQAGSNTAWPGNDQRLVSMLGGKRITPSQHRR